MPCGGFGNRAKKRRAYVVCMNGQVKRARRNSTHAVEPGCELIIPMKEQSNWNIQQTMSVATASASLATMVASIANILKTMVLLALLSVALFLPSVSSSPSLPALLA